MFVDYRIDLVEGSSKRARDELEQEVTKKKKVEDVQETAKVDDDQEAAKIKELMKIIPDENDVAIDVIPFPTKPLTIVDWKIHKEGKKNYYQITRVDGSSKMYLVFSHMLKSFDREDFETLSTISSSTTKFSIGSTNFLLAVLTAYRLRLPNELSEVHDTFHVSKLKKCLADTNLHVPLDEIEVDKTLHFVEKPVEIMDREVKTLKRSKIPIVKV
ncbi:hypothetical protein Tco_0087467, partial [Tanacetum coccineum]